MLKLAKAVNVEYLNKFAQQEKFLYMIESALLNVSGLIPEKVTFKDEKNSEYVRELIEFWDKLKSDYDGTYFKLEQWNFFKMRPQNFPTIRIA